MTYEEKMVSIMALVGAPGNGELALEAAIDAMSFVSLLHQSLVDNGAKLAEDPDIDEIGTTLDHVFGELSAACLFLSEPSFARVPGMLRKISAAIEANNAPWTDPSGDTAPPVPEVVIRGFKHLAKRLEATKVQKQRAIEALKNAGV